MRRFLLLMTLSAIGIGVGVAAILYGNINKPSGTVPLPSMTLPFKTFVAGTGLIESGSKNIAVGTPVAGVVKHLYVRSGESIHKGQLLLDIDDTLLRSKRITAQAGLETAKAKYLSAKHHFALIQGFKKASPQMVTRVQYTQAEDRLHEAQAALEASKAALKALSEEQERYHVRSPIDGVVLRSEVSEGDFFDNRSKALVVGSRQLYVRVSINAYDIPRFKPHTRAVAFMRGNTNVSVPLHYLYTIPYVVPKTDLTGRSTERTDTRVLQIMYALENTSALPLYTGEQLDVFSQTPKEDN